MEKVALGSVAPDFELKDQNDELVKLSDFIGKKNIVLYFYPKDETPGCTKEAC
ncbi:MAG: redoxin domain-containing protein, partial [Bacteroidetes bacterium]|nr:redoxin domain-containing protein [Bacteroidota bacterium]